MAKRANEKIMALIEGHIKKLGELELGPNVVSDKILHLLNTRFAQSFNKLVQDEQKLSLREEFYLSLNRGVLCHGDYKVEDLCDMYFSFMEGTCESDGFSINELYDANLEFFKEISFDFLAVYDGVWDPAYHIDEEGNEWDYEEHSSLENLEKLLYSSNMITEFEELFEKDESFNSLVTDIVTYYGDGEDHWNFIEFPLVETMLKKCSSKKEKEMLKYCLNVIEEFDANYAYQAWTFDSAKHTYYVFCEGFDGYNCVGASTRKLQFYYCLLWIDIFLRGKEVAV